MTDLISPDVEQLLFDATTSRSRRIKNRLASIWMLGALVVAVIPLALVIGYVLFKGIGQLSVAWFTEDLPAVTRKAGGGMGPAVVGTLLITLGAAVMAIPLGILGAIYLHEYGAKGRTARLIRFMADVMTGVPSIVMGLFVYTVWTLTFGLNGFGGSLALGCLMLPIIIRSTEEMLKLVPNSLREASAALGCRKSRTILGVVLPAALPGVVSGGLLAIARAAGETAPILFVVGAANAVNSNPFKGVNTALSAQIFANATQPFVGAQQRAWGAALTLLTLAFAATMIARMITARFALKR